MYGLYGNRMWIKFNIFSTKSRTSDLHGRSKSCMQFEQSFD